MTFPPSLASALVALALALAALAPPASGQDELAPPRARLAADAAEHVPAYAGVVDLLVREALERGRTYERLVELCTLAPQRLTGSAAYHVAADWARAQMERDGLSDVRLQMVTATHWERGEVGEVLVLEPSALAGPVPMLALGGSVASPPDGVVGELVVVRSIEEAEALGEDGRGRIVLFNRPLDAGLVDTFAAYGGAVRQRARGAIAAARVGAVGALVRSMTTLVDDVPHTGGMRYEEGVPAIPAAAISTRGAERLAAAVQAGQRVVVRLRQDCRTLPDTQVPNVIGELRGRELPDEIVLVGGHLDSWDVGQGAHDDGGGCCQALEAVRLIQSLGLRPRRTIRVVLFANEENGLAGGRGYLAAHLDEMPRHLLALESDSGVFTPRGFETNATGSDRDALAAICRLLEDAGAGRLLPAESGGADIGPMREHGVLQVGFMPDSQRYFDVHHSARDTLELVNERELELGTAVIAAMVYVVADLP